MKSPLRWPGGKGRLTGAILPHVRKHDAYVETCCGGAAVFWAKPRDLSNAEILNDADGDLVNFYRVLHRYGRRLARELDAMPYSRGLFASQLAAKPTSAFGRARRFWYLNRVAFGARRQRPTFGVAVSRRMSVLPARILQDLDQTVERLRGVQFESIDVTRLIRLYDRPSTLFYIDPPFYRTAQPYVCRFGQADHRRLAECLRAIAGVFLLSYDDCSEVRQLYRGCQVRKLDTRYGMGRNSRSGRKSAGTGKATELLISNRPLCVVRARRQTVQAGMTGRQRLVE